MVYYRMIQIAIYNSVKCFSMKKDKAMARLIKLHDHFKLSGAANQHNSVYHSRENPHVMIGGQLKHQGLQFKQVFHLKRYLDLLFPT